MDNITIFAIIGILALLLLFGVAGGLFVLRRRRARVAAEAVRAEAKQSRVRRRRARKTDNQETAAQPLSPEQASLNGRKAEAQPHQAAAAPTPVTDSAATKSSGNFASGAQYSAPSAGHPSRIKPLDDRNRTGEEIRILIVDDNPGTRENVSRLLYFEDDLEVIGQAINGREGVEMAIDLKPHIVLMDINMPDMDGITATQEMATKAPFSQVIIMSVQSDQHYMKRAMAAGARDFQPKPFTSQELVSCIRRVYNIGLPTYRQFEVFEKAQAQQAEQATSPGDEQAEQIDSPVFAVYSPKGGVGTSAVATNLAVALRQVVGDIVLMDGNLQFGDVLVHLNTRPTRTISDLVQQEQFEVELLADILLPHDSGVKLLLAPPQPQLAEVISPAIVADIIKHLKKQFKMVVVDTHSLLKDLTLTILEEADYILLVITPELPAIKSAKLFLEIAEQLEFDMKRLLVIINQADKPGGVNIEKIEKVLNLPNSYQIPYDPKLHFALSRGQSVCQSDSGAASARAIVSLAQELSKKFKPEAFEEPA
jgi:pilus assembly protein CpaE